jgi:hypothetical protein
LLSIDELKKFKLWIELRDHSNIEMVLFQLTEFNFPVQYNSFIFVFPITKNPGIQKISWFGKKFLKGGGGTTFIRKSGFWQKQSFYTYDWSYIGKKLRGIDSRIIFWPRLQKSGQIPKKLILNNSTCKKFRLRRESNLSGENRSLWKVLEPEFWISKIWNYRFLSEIPFRKILEPVFAVKALFLRVSLLIDVFWTAKKIFGFYVIICTKFEKILYWENC